METPYNEHRPQMTLPNATIILVLGILSIVFTCCFSPLGLILAIIALVMNSKEQKLYNADPERYIRSSYNNLQTGKILAIIGLALSLIGTIVTIYMLTTNGTMIWQEYMNQMREAKEA